MENDPVLCFQHCRSDANILCLKVPPNCPVCGEDTDSTAMKIPPFRLPSPFIHSREVPFSVVFKPTVGTFLQDYTKVANLHVGITNSKGVVYDFDEKGINRHQDGWSQCLTAYSLTRPDAYTRSMWNMKIQEFTAYSEWLPEKYSETNHNCYDFVLGFAHQVSLGDSTPAFKDKATITEQLLAPKIKQANQYITLYRKLVQEGTSVQYSSSEDCSTSL